MVKFKRYWWRADGRVVYGEWTGCHEKGLLWMRDRDGALWKVPSTHVNSEDAEDWSYKSEKKIV